ncbi:hypothetical protein Glove_876g1 [Diversispora epigaea]|uniref:Uncharacterized protein n=1 Tax=Diversispora epigaea TaxID=1348612 RepID=A0A397G322_9GLOM|nr:hypothetical protein Glove_876g1 [Diversispora epigaea]
MNYIQNFLIPENNNNQEEEQEETPPLEPEETRERASTLPPKKNTEPRNSGNNKNLEPHKHYNYYHKTRIKNINTSISKIRKNTELKHRENRRTENKSKSPISSKISRHQKVRTAPGSRTAQEKPGRLGNGFQEQEHPQQEQLERERIQPRIDLPDFTLLTTSPRRRNRPLTAAGPSQTQPIVNPTPRAREELVPHIIHITEEDKQVISAQEILVI